MDIEHLKRFIVVGRCLNFSRAADELFITQPTLSHTISNLEAQLGFKLFQRNTKNVTLSPAGEIFLETAEKIVKSYDDGIDRILREMGLKEETLTIGFSGVSMDGGFPVWLKRFREENPRVVIQLQRLMANEIGAAFDQGKVDFVLAYEMNAEGYPDLQCRLVDSEEFQLLISSEHPLAQEQSIDLKQLGHIPLLVRDRELSHRYYSKVIEICENRGYAPQVMNIKADFGEIRRMVEEGLGVAILSHGRQDNKPDFYGRVRFIRIDDGEDLKNSVLLIWKGRMSDPAQKFYEIIKDSLKNNK